MKLNWKHLQLKKPNWKKPSKKALVVSGASLSLVAAIVLGIVLIGGAGKEPVGVYPFTMVGMDGYWGDSQESYGPVSTDKIQTIYLSDTQTVTEVLVAQGDTVKKGDVLLAFDTSLSDLQLERKRLEVEKLKLELDAARADLKTIQGLTPMEPMPDLTLPSAPTFQGNTLNDPYKTYIVAGHDGKTADTPFVCWVKDSSNIDEALLEKLRLEVWKGLDDGKCGHRDYTYANCPICNCTHGGQDKLTCIYCKPCPHASDTVLVKADCPICNPEICEHKEVKALCSTCNPAKCVHGNVMATCPLCSDLCSAHAVPLNFCKKCCPIHDEALTADGKCATCESIKQAEAAAKRAAEEAAAKAAAEAAQKAAEEEAAAKAAAEAAAQAAENATTETTAPVETEAIAYTGLPYRILLLSSTETTAPSTPTTPTTPSTSATPDSYFVVFKSTSGNTELGPQTLWQGAQVQGKGKGFQIQYFSPTIDDYTVPAVQDTPITMPDYDPGSGLTAAQIAQLRSDQEQKIKELVLKHKMANAEYKIMAKEMGDGHIYAEFDGNVVSILEEKEARDQKQPVLKVSGGGGFFIAGSVSELEKENLKVGQEVTVNDWNTGGVYTGTVKDIGDFPSIDSYWNGAGNPNATYYPFTVFVDEEASLQAGAYANIQYSTSEAASGIYLEKAFLRTEAGKSYVYLRGADGNLEKRFVTTGKTLWGSYVEIKDGLTVEDYIAFPYGKDVKSGVSTREGDLAELYGY